jgi:hypothetical protein
MSRADDTDQLPIIITTISDAELSGIANEHALVEFRELLERVPEELTTPLPPNAINGKDPCGLWPVVPGMDAQSELAFQTARSEPITRIAEAVLGPGVIAIRSQLVGGGRATEWHHDDCVLRPHIGDEAAVAVVLPLCGTLDMEFETTASPGPQAHRLASGPFPQPRLERTPGPTSIMRAEPGQILALGSRVVHRWLTRSPDVVALSIVLRSSSIRRAEAGRA